MEKFAECIAKFAVWISLILGILLLGVAALLIFAPKVLLTAIYYALIIGSAAGACYFLFGVIGTVIVICQSKKGTSYDSETQTTD